MFTVQDAPVSLVVVIAINYKNCSCRPWLYMHRTKLWRDYHITKVAINTVLNLSYYASIMLNALRDLLCSKLCWHNGAVHVLSSYKCHLAQVLLY